MSTEIDQLRADLAGTKAALAECKSERDSCAKVRVDFKNEMDDHAITRRERDAALARAAEMEKHAGGKLWSGVLLDYAQRIAALEAENARLREALEAAPFPEDGNPGSAVWVYERCLARPNDAQLHWLRKYRAPLLAPAPAAKLADYTLSNAAQVGHYQARGVSASAIAQAGGEVHADTHIIAPKQDQSTRSDKLTDALESMQRCSGLGRKPIWCIERLEPARRGSSEGDWTYEHGDWHSLEGAQAFMRSGVNHNFTHRIVRVEQTRTVIDCGADHTKTEDAGAEGGLVRVSSEDTAALRVHDAALRALVAELATRLQHHLDTWHPSVNFPSARDALARAREVVG